MNQNDNTIQDLEKKAAKIRADLVKMSNAARAAHLGSALSCADILTVLYGSFLSLDKNSFNDPDRNRFILSKGHAASVLYATLSQFGMMEPDLLKTYGKEGSLLEEHPGTLMADGIEAATGSLGHGLSLGVGIAMAARIIKKKFKTYVLISDGECNEGSVWEAAMFAAGQKLENLTVIVDFNKWQATGRSCEVMGLEPLVDKFQAFGWNAVETDGHDMKKLLDTLEDMAGYSAGPKAVVAHTVKGKGISFMEDDNNWHYRIPTDDEVIKASKELGVTI